MNRTEKSIQNFKAIELIKTFSSLEMKRFGRFLQSPYHNNNQDVVILFDFLRPLYPAFDQAKLNRPKIWKVLFKTKPFQAIKFKKLFSELNLLAEEFISIESLKSNKRAQQKQMITALKPRHFKRFVKASGVLIEEIAEKGAYQSQADFLDLHLLYQDLWHHIEWEKHQVNQKELLAAHEALVTYMDFNKVRTVSEIETRKKFLNLSDYTYPESLKGIIEKKISQKNQHYILYYNLLNFVKKPNRDDYVFLKTQIFENHTFLNRTLLQDCLIHLNNYLSNEIALGKSDLQKEMFFLLKWAGEQNTFVNDGKILEAVFSNTVIMSIKNQQFVWAENYIIQNEKYLKSINKELVLGYLKASLAYFKKKFLTVISILIKLQPSHQVQYYFFFKSMMTRSLFELILQGELVYQESLFNELDAFEKGIRRNRKFSENRKGSYLNFIKILRQLIPLFVIKENRSHKLFMLKTKIDKLSSLAQRTWLLDKIDFLQK